MNAAMQPSGQIKAQGDMTKLMALQTSPSAEQKALFAQGLRSADPFRDSADLSVTPGHARRYFLRSLYGQTDPARAEYACSHDGRRSSRNWFPVDAGGRCWRRYPPGAQQDPSSQLRSRRSPRRIRKGVRRYGTKPAGENRQDAKEGGCGSKGSPEQTRRPPTLPAPREAAKVKEGACGGEGMHVPAQAPGQQQEKRRVDQRRRNELRVDSETSPAQDWVSGDLFWNRCWRHRPGCRISLNWRRKTGSVLAGAIPPCCAPSLNVFPLVCAA